MKRKAELNRELNRHESVGVLLIPLFMCILAMMMAVESPSFAAAVITTGLY
jgi:hypothetical protein